MGYDMGWHAAIGPRHGLSLASWLVCRETPAVMLSRIREAPSLCRPRCAPRYEHRLKLPLLHLLLLLGLLLRLGLEGPARALRPLLLHLLLLLPFKELRDGPPEVVNLGAAQTRLQSRRAAWEGLAPAPAAHTTAARREDTPGYHRLLCNCSAVDPLYSSACTWW